MILEEATKEAYGYYSKDLKLHSVKCILATCELCGEFKVTTNNAYCTFCHSCSLRLGEAQKGDKNSFFGEHHTEEAKVKMREAKMGNKNLNYGNHFSAETRVKLSRARKRQIGKDAPTFGMHHTEKTKVLLSKAKIGNKNPNWLGGVSFGKYCEKFNNAYKQLIRCKFNNRCFLCGITTEENGKALDVHHVNYNKDCGCDNSKCVCVPLCRSCHSRTNSNREYWEERIMIALKNTLLGWE